MPENLISMVALPSKALPKPQAVIDRIEAMREPGDPMPKLIDEGVDETNAFTVAVGAYAVAVIKMPFPIPPGTLEDAIENELIWKQGKFKFAKAKAHAVVAVISPSGNHEDLLRQARLLTLVTAAVTEAWRGVGIYWPSARSIIEPSHFCAATREMLKSEFASPLWFSVRFYPGREHEMDMRIVCQSTGLDIFLGRELECGPYDIDPAELGNRIISVTRFMASSGPVFAHQHTFSFGTDPKAVDAQLEYRWSPLGGVEKPVFGLRLMAHEKLAA